MTDNQPIGNVSAIEKAIARFNDIRRKLSVVEASQKSIAISLSDKEDEGIEPEFVKLSMDEWYNAADCLQFLICNADTIQEAMLAAADAPGNSEALSVDRLAAAIVSMSNANDREDAGRMSSDLALACKKHRATITAAQEHVNKRSGK